MNHNMGSMDFYANEEGRRGEAVGVVIVKLPLRPMFAPVQLSTAFPRSPRPATFPKCWLSLHHQSLKARKAGLVRQWESYPWFRRLLFTKMGVFFRTLLGVTSPIPARRRSHF